MYPGITVSVHFLITEERRKDPYTEQDPYTYQKIKGVIIYVLKNLL